jgi:hypothetical protein
MPLRIVPTADGYRVSQSQKCPAFLCNDRRQPLTLFRVCIIVLRPATPVQDATRRLAGRQVQGPFGGRLSRQVSFVRGEQGISQLLHQVWKVRTAGGSIDRTTKVSPAWRILISREYSLS